jgi:hypothetical protein
MRATITGQEWQGWIRRVATARGLAAHGWTLVCDGDSEAEATAALERVRLNERPWMTFATVEMVVLRRGQHPHSALRSGKRR